ncbi:MAG: DUF6526 family protein [Bacteroidota bacterium]|nr:DUF6526 family protein [Bacteroidota bacterium]
MSNQNLKNHARIVPGYHYLLFLILFVCLVISTWNIFRACNHQSGRLVAVAIFGLTISALLLAWYTRSFALAAQDRAIRAEEKFRHFVLTGKLPDSRLTLKQLIALRFAEDAEFILLAQKAADNNMSPVDIKKAIINWKSDEHRV